jgi:hypothetical protein
MIKTFMPSGDDSDTLAVTTASSRAQLDPLSSAVRVVNAGAAMAFIQFGDVNVLSTTAKMPINAGATETFTKGSAGYVAAICASGTTTLYVTCGEGL